ncbi:MAG: hypothetical protein KDK99_01880, partial [Verrucomicrobiales bacterium]|nr:hypothetical protein [Verrucomicrobiales bacterium]
MSRMRLEFGYDHRSRRVLKRVWTGADSGSGVTWILQSDTRFVYHGWNMFAEIEPSRGTEARQPADAGGCPAGVRQRGELPKQHQP